MKRENRSDLIISVTTVCTAVLFIVCFLAMGREVTAKAAQTAVSEGTYVIECGKKYLNAEDHEYGEIVTGKLPQVFEIRNGKNGGYNIVSNAPERLMFDYLWDDAEEGSGVIIYPGTTEKTQDFCFEPAGKKDTYYIYCKAKPDLYLSINGNSIVLVGKKQKKSALKVTLCPAEVGTVSLYRGKTSALPTKNGLSWKTGNKKIAKIAKNKIKAVAAGNTVLFAKSKKDNVYHIRNVIVSKKNITNSVAVITDSKGRYITAGKSNEYTGEVSLSDDKTEWVLVKCAGKQNTFRIKRTGGAGGYLTKSYDFDNERDSVSFAARYNSSGIQEWIFEKQNGKKVWIVNLYPEKTVMTVQKGRLYLKPYGEKTDEDCFTINETGGFEYETELLSKNGRVSIVFNKTLTKRMTEKQLQAMADDLEKVYDRYAELQGFTPAGKIEMHCEDNILDAAGYVTGANDSIYFYPDGIVYGEAEMEEQEKYFGRPALHFGLLHEMGHVFDGGRNFCFDSEALTTMRIMYLLCNSDYVSFPEGWPYRELQPEFTNERLLSFHEAMDCGKLADGYSVTPVSAKFARIFEELGWEHFTYVFKNWDESRVNGKDRFEVFKEWVRLISESSGKDVKAMFSDREWKNVKAALEGVYD